MSSNFSPLATWGAPTENFEYPAYILPAPQKLLKIFGKFFRRMWEDTSAFELIFFVSFRRAQYFRHNRLNEGNFSAFLLPIRYSLAKPLGRANAITLQMASCRHRSDFDTVTLGLHLHCNKKRRREWPLGLGGKWRPFRTPLLIRRQTLVLFALWIYLHRTINQNDGLAFDYLGLHRCIVAAILNMRRVIIHQRWSDIHKIFSSACDEAYDPI